MFRTWYGAGVIAGLAVFCWGALAHMALGLGGESTFKQVPDPALAAMAANVKDPGLYMFPYSKDMNQTAKLIETNPYGIMIFAPAGTPMNMGAMLATEAVTDILACIIAGWLLSIAMPRLSTFTWRVAFVMGLGLFSFFTSEVPYWNWYRFPTDFTAYSLVFKLSVALVAGVVLTLLMGRAAPATVPAGQVVTA